MGEYTDESGNWWWDNEREEVWHKYLDEDSGRYWWWNETTNVAHFARRAPPQPSWDAVSLTGSRSSSWDAVSLTGSETSSSWQDCVETMLAEEPPDESSWQDCAETMLAE